MLFRSSKGGDFVKLAAENSIDPSGKDNGGDLGFFKKGDMVPEFSEMAFSLKEGQTAERPVKSQFGWHVIRVDKVRTVAQALEVRREILALLERKPGALSSNKACASGISGKVRNSPTRRRFKPVSGLPRTTISPRLKSTSAQVTNRASPIRRPVKARKRIKSAHGLDHPLPEASTAAMKASNCAGSGKRSGLGSA